VREGVDLSDVVAAPGAEALLAVLDRLRLPWAVVTSADERLARARLGAAGIPDPPLLVTVDRGGRRHERTLRPVGSDGSAAREGQSGAGANSARTPSSRTGRSWSNHSATSSAAAVSASASAVGSGSVMLRVWVKNGA
jgi:hypothetical protein